MRQMTKKTFMRTTCRHCGKDVSINGMAQYSHNMKHVREGLLIREVTKYGSTFRVANPLRQAIRSTKPGHVEELAKYLRDYPLEEDQRNPRGGTAINSVSLSSLQEGVEAFGKGMPPHVRQ